jgi:hypothetical protein
MTRSLNEAAVSQFATAGLGRSVVPDWTEDQGDVVDCLLLGTLPVHPQPS